ncbi:hypothetical protein [uncultured Halomonas sp.]|uniref:hypothetical protein n=1 Tax=uncultured Halomonas sp. TaxID=173971 RepID=UPI0026231282|nr:hypothetical protein [uncultured Halomonas sp.]
MFFVIERKHVAPSQHQERYTGFHAFEVSSQPVRYSSSGEVCLNDYCGEENGIATYAHGEHPTAEAAESWIEMYMTGLNLDFREDEELSDGVVTRFCVGRYRPISAEGTRMSLYGMDMSDIEADTTNERIAEIVTTFQEGARVDGREFCESTLERAFKEHRQMLRDE